MSGRERLRESLLARLAQTPPEQRIAIDSAFLVSAGELSRLLTDSAVPPEAETEQEFIARRAGSFAKALADSERLDWLEEHAVEVYQYVSGRWEVWHDGGEAGEGHALREAIDNARLASTPTRETAETEAGDG